MTQSTAYRMHELLREKNSIDKGKQQSASKKDSKKCSSNKFRELQRKQMASRSNAQEAELQRETADLIQKMRTQATNGNIPEYGQAIIDVLLNYQGKKKKSKTHMEF